jgi:hypothetical protein
MMLPNAHQVRGATVAVPHIYRDSKAVADAVGGTVGSSGWYPGTGVAYRTVEMAGATLTVVSAIDYHQSRDHPWGRAVYEASRPGIALLSVELSGDGTGFPERGDLAWVPQRRRPDGSYDSSSPVTRVEAPDHWLTLDIVADADASDSSPFADVVAEVDLVTDGTWSASPRLNVQTPAGSIELVGTPR